jgi:hypothetical protein
LFVFDQANDENQKGVLDQIYYHIESKKQDRDKTLNEGTVQQETQEARHQRLERLKQKKLAELKAENIPDKYLVDIEKFKV